MKVAILGYGEIGKAIAKFYKKIYVKDLDRDDGIEDCDVLHVCIPYNCQFVKTIKSVINKSKAKLTIIHSTVQLCATKKIGGNVVHSPCRGVHPDLSKSIKTFVKYIGADDMKAGKEAEKHLNSIGIKTKLVKGSRNTEAMKLWETTQNMAQVILNKEIWDYCQKHKLDFSTVYSDHNRTFNEGYKKMAKKDWMLQILKFMSGKVGGHCQTPNAKLLGVPLSKFLLKRNEILGKN